jgi:hypothetical protein
LLLLPEEISDQEKKVAKKASPKRKRSGKTKAKKTSPKAAKRSPGRPRATGTVAQQKRDCLKVKKEELCDTLPNCDWRKHGRAKKASCGSRKGVRKGAVYQGPVGPSMTSRKGATAKKSTKKTSPSTKKSTKKPAKTATKKTGDIDTLSAAENKQLDELLTKVVKTKGKGSKTRLSAGAYYRKHGEDASIGDVCDIRKDGDKRCLVGYTNKKGKFIPKWASRRKSDNKWPDPRCGKLCRAVEFA